MNNDLIYAKNKYLKSRYIHFYVSDMHTYVSVLIKQNCRKGILITVTLQDSFKQLFSSTFDVLVFSITC